MSHGEHYHNCEPVSRCPECGCCDECDNVCECPVSLLRVGTRCVNEDCYCRGEIA